MTDPMSTLMSTLMADLTYRCYAHNRDLSPDITPASWKKVFGPEVDDFEARYQADKLIERVMG
jgi:hypothetical protein